MSAKQDGADFVVIGAGVIGIAIARALRRRLNASVTVIEKEAGPAYHASGRNSGVIHAGVYYPAGSLKARLCVEGNRLLRGYCDEKGIPSTRAGKVIVSRDEGEVAGLEELHRRSTANGICVSWLNAQDLAQVEPSARSVGKALFVHDTAVVNPLQVVEAMVADAVREGVRILYDCRWMGTRDGQIVTSRGELSGGHLVNAAGLHADRIAHAFGVGLQFRLLPFRGGFFQLSPASSVRCNGNVYPVPDLRNPFLGVHFTRRPDGIVTVGPTALPLLGREQYEGLAGMDAMDGLWMVRFLASLLLKNMDHFRSIAFVELAKMFRYGFYRAASGLVEGLQLGDLLPGKRSGIRAQLADVHKMEMINDFLIQAGPRSTHILNAVSPAFTCSLPFAELVVDQMAGLHTG